MTSTAAHPGSGPREETHALFAFRLGRDLFLVPADEVAAVIATEVPTPLPRVPPHVLGLVNHDHRALAVLDLARFLAREGDAGGAERARTLVLKGGDATVGVPVTAALGVVTVAASAVRPASGAFGSRIGDVLRGECETPHGPGAWIDLTRLLEAARV
jgi:chemotaxis signal transduction protein